MKLFSKKTFFFTSLLAVFFSLLLLGRFSSRVAAQDEPTPFASPTPSAMLSVTPSISPCPTSSPVPSATPSPTQTDFPVQEIGGDYVQNEILVRFASSAGDAQTATDACFANEQVQPAFAIAEIGATVLTLGDISVSEAVARAKACPSILLAEPNYRLHATDTFPNDTYWHNQYGLVAVRAPQGWDISTGSAAVTIAVIDTGVALTHPDLAAKIVAGYDFVNNDDIPQDDNGHGTHVAGIAAASSNNGVGVAGVSWHARIMPVKVLDAAANGSFANAAAGIIWATDHGAQIINLSLGGTSDSVIFQDAIDYAYHHGVMLIAASGNSGSNFVLYPARYPNVMAVGATDANNALAPFSNYGAEIDVVAPGVDIFSTWLGGNYQNDSGTSMSAPYVAGLAAILRGIPGSGSPANLAWAMKTTALDLGVSGRDDYYGDGLIQMDAAIALLWVTETPVPTATLTPSATPAPQQTRPVTGYTPPAFYPTATLIATASPSASPAPTLFLSPTVLFPASAAETESSPELFALSTPTDILGGAEKSAEKSFVLPCFGSFLLLLGIFLFFLGKKLRKTAER